ncbi:MAG TPA: glycosyltransferase family 4 protein [Bacteroidia bacterium]|nr:glycosyltransferase family 4 protein [Bacteroidia bacterium]
MNLQVNIIFLYTEIAPYLLACCNKLVEDKNANVHIIRYPVNNEAPFVFSPYQKVNLYDRKEYQYIALLNLIERLNPSAIICSGWIDKEYLRICKKYYKKIPTILSLDTHWNSSLKQYVAALVSPFVIKNKFSHAWVPGIIQKKYAEKLGFKKTEIILGFYSCDVEHFFSIRDKIITLKKQIFPKRFIFVGRYYDFKGVDILWQAFIELQNENPNEWELWCLGTGSLQPVQHPKIRHCGFIQPEDFLEYAQQTGVFVMPSLFEPWGVVLHEFAAMGFPLLASDKVGAIEAFLQDTKNGFVFKAGDVNSLKEKLKELMHLPPEQLNLMGEYSYRLAQNITPKKWADNLMKLI